MIGWILGLLGAIVAIFGGLFFLKSTFYLKGELKVSIFYLVLAALIYVLFSSLMVYFGFIKLSIYSVYWEVLAVLFFGSSCLFIIGSFKLVKVLKEIKKN